MSLELLVMNSRSINYLPIVQFFKVSSLNRKFTSSECFVSEHIFSISFLLRYQDFQYSIPQKWFGLILELFCVILQNRREPKSRMIEKLRNAIIESIRRHVQYDMFQHKNKSKGNANYRLSICRCSIVPFTHCL